MKEDPAPETWAVVPRKIKKRRQHFVMVPWSWIERLNGAAGQTYRVAVILLYMGWKGRGDPVKLSNVALTIDGVRRVKVAGSS